MNDASLAVCMVEHANGRHKNLGSMDANTHSGTLLCSHNNIITVLLFCCIPLSVFRISSSSIDERTDDATLCHECDLTGHCLSASLLL